MSKTRGYRKNTLVVDFTVMPSKPTAPEVQKFIAECLKLEFTSILNLQLAMQKSHVYIELIPSIAADEVANKMNGKYCMTTPEGLQKPIPVLVADGSVEVKIYDLPPYMPDETVANHLTTYGEVLSVKRELWHDYFPGIPNGTRVIRMRLKQAIPSYIQVEDITAFVRYRNQILTCKHCSRHLHIGKKCSEIKKALTDGTDNNLTLADIIRGKNPQPREPTDINEDGNKVSDTGNNMVDNAIIGENSPISSIISLIGNDIAAKSSEPDEFSISEEEKDAENADEIMDSDSDVIPATAPNTINKKEHQSRADQPTIKRLGSPSAKGHKDKRRASSRR